MCPSQNVVLMMAMTKCQSFAKHYKKNDSCILCIPKTVSTRYMHRQYFILRQILAVSFCAFILVQGLMFF